MSDSVQPRDGSPPGSPVPGILQARILEWVAISFSNSWKWKVKVKSLSRVQLLATPWTPAYQAPPSMGFSRQGYWSGVPLPSPACFAGASFTCWAIKEAQKENIGLKWYIRPMDLIDIYRLFYPKTAEFTFFSSAHETLSKIYYI